MRNGTALFRLEDIMSLEKEREGKALSPTGIMDALEN